MIKIGKNFRPDQKMLAKIFRNGFFVFCLLLFLPNLFFSKAWASDWAYPMDRYFERQTLKEFGQLIDQNFYKGKEGIFPFNQLYGYHSGVDLEIFPEEKDQKVPVYAIGSGKIIFLGTISGYGGVILQSLAGEDRTAIYGHIKTTDLLIKISDPVTAGQEITFLGDNFSSETAKERKHLHFGIYKGNDLYFRGHESSQELISTKWEDPNQFLAQKKASSPDLSEKSASISSNGETFLSPQPSLFYKTVKFLNWILGRIFGV